MTGSAAARLDDLGPDRPSHGYRSRVLAASGVDELIADSGQARLGSEDLLASVDLLGLTGLLARRAEAARLVEDEGVIYGVPGDPAESPMPDSPMPDSLVPEARSITRGPARRWKVDPIPVVLDAAGWQRLQTGLTQRAELLDRVLADLYGERRLLHRGVLPAEAVLSHPGFVRQADRLRLPGNRQLFLTATDLGKAADGSWQVIGDRTQAPSGAGYAIQTRRIVARVMPALYRDTPLRRLRSFFDVMRSALSEIAPRSGSASAEVPRVVLLTPGPGSETAFDQSFLATLLGFPLVTGEDLMVKGGRVQMRSLGRLDPVDVVMRRVDADFADPLELRADSQLGVPGLLEAGRAGQVSVVNGFGAGVLESPAVLAFLPAIARALLGEDLAIGSPQTWWCGSDGDRRHVLARLDSLVVKSVDRSLGLFGWELPAARLDELRRQIEAEPHAWCAQEPLEMSTAPVVTSRGLEARRFTLRTFAVAGADGYHLMSGGLGRVAARVDAHLITNSAGALAKDVWVLAPEPVTGPLLIGVDAAGGAEAGEGLGWRPRHHPVAGLPPRVAENLFWLGRYAERAEDTVRLVRVVDDLAEDWASRPGTRGGATFRSMLDATRRITGTLRTGSGYVSGFSVAGMHPVDTDHRIDAGEGGPALAGYRELRTLVADRQVSGSIAYSVQHTVAAAQALREQLSLDTWIVLGSLDRVLDELNTAGSINPPASAAGPAGMVADPDPPLAPVLARVIEGLLALAGLGAESMVRDVGWHFMDAGRRLERALQVLALLRHTLDRHDPDVDHALQLETVLIVGESIITHRRRHQGRARVETALELLLLDRENPRSVALQLDRLADDLAQFPDQPPAASALPARLRRVTARLREFDPVTAGIVWDGGRPYLVEQLDELIADLSGLAGAIEAAHFTHVAPSRPTPAVFGWVQ